jgi:hypothetical protein
MKGLAEAGQHLETGEPGVILPVSDRVLSDLQGLKEAAG